MAARAGIGYVSSTGDMVKWKTVRIREDQLQQAQHGRRHRPQGRHRYVPPPAEADGPRKVGVGHDTAHLLGLQPAVQELLQGSFHLGVDGLDEAGEVGGAVELGGDDVGDGD